MLLQKYKSQKSTAVKRGVSFRLTYNDWLKIWIDSGKLDKRGRNRGDFVMCRKNDTGAYEIGNVFIATGTKNLRDICKFKKVKEEAKDLLIQELKQKLWIKTLNSPEWKAAEQNRKDKAERRTMFKNRSNQLFYNGKDIIKRKKKNDSWF